MKDQQQHQTFPYKLYEMIEYACDSEFSSSLSWSANGCAFIIHDKEVMMEDLAPKFFKQTKFRSFVSVVSVIFQVIGDSTYWSCFCHHRPETLTFSSFFFVSFAFQTRQLNIWGFVRSDTLGGEKGGWQHKDFLRGRPDLLTEIERTEVKSAVKKSPSVPKSKSKASSASSRSVRTKAMSSLSSSSSVQSFGTDPSAQAEAMYRHSVDTTSNAQQPFNDDDLMYLASIFDKDEQHSNDNDLSSILSLNQETSVEDYFFGL